MPLCFCGWGRGLGHQTPPPKKNVSASGVGLFSSSPRQLPSPDTVVCPVYMEESANGVGGGGSVAAFLETGKQMFPRQPRGVTSAHGLRLRCLHDTGARSADCGPKKPNGSTIRRPRCQRTINAPPQGKHSPSSWIHTGEVGKLQSGPASAK